MLLINQNCVYFFLEMSTPTLPFEIVTQFHLVFYYSDICATRLLLFWGFVIVTAYDEPFICCTMKMFQLHVQSDLLVVKKQMKRYCPIYFQKVCQAAFYIMQCFLDLDQVFTTYLAVQEDIERELTRASKGSRGSALSKQIMVCSYIRLLLAEISHEN